MGTLTCLINKQTEINEQAGIFFLFIKWKMLQGGLFFCLLHEKVLQGRIFFSKMLSEHARLLGRWEYQWFFRNFDDYPNFQQKARGL